MKNIPMFTTEAGIASLILEEIPYKKVAYIRIHSSSSPEVLLNDAASLCKAAGAEHVYAMGHAFLEHYPVHTEIVRMECKKDDLPKAHLQLEPVSPETLQLWCDIYNDKMREVPNTATLYPSKLRKENLVDNCYFVYDTNRMLGIGMIHSGMVDAVASLVSGSGSDVVATLCSMLNDETISVEVAVNNIPAISLYKKMGFELKESISKWYCL